MRTEIERPFKFEIPFAAFAKAGEAGKERRIGGIISTEACDQQGEVILQKGLDFTYFLKNGWFNDNHSKKTTDIVGYPMKVVKTMHNGRPAHYVEGYLIADYEPADRIWKLANALQRTDRRLGFSIEGAVRRREGRNDEVIAQALVRNVAITNSPVNDDTALDVLVKSMQAVCSAEDYDRSLLERALTAGQATEGGTPSPGDGFALRTESMERDPKKDRKSPIGKITKAEALALLHERYSGLTKAQAKRVLAFAMTH